LRRFSGAFPNSHVASGNIPHCRSRRGCPLANGVSQMRYHC
jgi:hypothetical protein